MQKFIITDIEWEKGTAMEKHTIWAKLPKEETVEIDPDGGYYETDFEHRQYIREALGDALTEKHGWGVCGFTFTVA